MRRRLRKAERDAKRDYIRIPLVDGTVAKFPQSAAADAYVNVMERLGAGEDAPPEHPLCAAARNSSDRWWRESVYAPDPEDIAAPIEDLSEP